MLKQKHWRPFEDNLLLQIIQLNGNKLTWKNVSEELELKGVHREPEQCKRRYLNNLKNDLNKTRLTLPETQKVFSLFVKYRNAWKFISSHFHNRTDNIIKNTFFSVVKKTLRRMNKLCGGKIDNSIINRTRPKIIIELLDTSSDDSFPDKFDVISLVQNLAFNYPESVLDDFPLEMAEKANHCIDLFIKVKTKGDGSFHSYGKSMSKFKSRKSSYIRQEGVNSLFSGFGDHVRSVLYQVEFFHDQLILVNPLDRLGLLDSIIGFVSFSRSFFFNSAVIKDSRVFVALKDCMAESSRLLVVIIEEDFNNRGKDVNLFNVFKNCIARLKKSLLLLLSKYDGNILLEGGEKEIEIGKGEMH